MDRKKVLIGILGALVLMLVFNAGISTGGRSSQDTVPTNQPALQASAAAPVVKIDPAQFKVSAVVTDCKQWLGSKPDSAEAVVNMKNEGVNSVEFYGRFSLLNKNGQVIGDFNFITGPHAPGDGFAEKLHANKRCEEIASIRTEELNLFKVNGAVKTSEQEDAFSKAFTIKLDEKSFLSQMAVSSASSMTAEDGEKGAACYGYLSEYGQRFGGFEQISDLASDMKIQNLNEKMMSLIDKVKADCSGMSNAACIEKLGANEGSMYKTLIVQKAAAAKLPNDQLEITARMICAPVRTQ